MKHPISHSRFRRFLVPLCAMLLAGCVRSAPDPAQRYESHTSQEERSTLVLLMPGDSDDGACERMSKKVSDITSEKLGFDVQLEQIPTENYENSLWQRLMEENAPDIFYLPGKQALSNYVYENEIYPLSALLERHPDLYNVFTEEQWNCKKKHRTIYAIPVATSDCYCMGFMARKDILQEMGVQAEQIRTMDQLHELLKQVKQQYPDMVPVVPDYGRVQQELGQDPLGDDLGVLMANGGTVVTNLYASEAYAQLCTEMYRWYQEGLILKNACMRTESATDLMDACNGFGFFCKFNADFAERCSRTYGEELEVIRLSTPTRNSSGMADGWCLPVQQSLKEEALDFLEMLYTDPELATLFLYGDGEEGGWENADVNLRAAETQTEMDSREVEEETAVSSKAYGFVFNTSQSINELDACRVVAKRYDAALTSGCLNPNEAIPRFLQELQEAGIESVIAEKQRQLNDWLAAYAS